MGILATELRIGNWYLSTKFQVPVICEMGDFYEIYARADGSTEYTVDDIFQSIPLTEEWLLKFGFEFYEGEMIGETSMNDNWTLGLFKINVWDNGCLFYWDDKFDNRIKYVHQLQNLYFALTGEELKIN